MVRYGDAASYLIPQAVPRQLYPEWPLAATSIVDRDLAVEVAAALMSINSSHDAVCDTGAVIRPLVYTRSVLHTHACCFCIVVCRFSYSVPF